MTFRVTVLGCDGSYTGPGGAASGYLVRSASATVLLDMGTGTFANLQLHCDPKELDAVILTHRHMDHCADIRMLQLYLSIEAPDFRLPVYAAPEVYEAIYDNECACPDVLVWSTLEDRDELDIGDLCMTFSQTEHWVPTFAVSVRANNRRFLYSSDTGPHWSAADAFGTGFELAFIECTLANDAPNRNSEVKHLSPTTAAQIARDAQIARFLLTHLLPSTNRREAKARAAHVFGMPVECVEIGNTYEVSASCSPTI